MAEPSPRRRLPAAQRRELILAAAEEVFARGGYHGASLDEIAQAAGVSKALIYEHFDSKRDLHASLLESHVAEIFRRLQANAETGATGEERLRGGVDAFLLFVEEHREAWRAVFRDAADPEVADVVDRLQQQATGVIAALMAEASGTPPADGAREAVEVHAQLLSGAVQGLANWWYRHPQLPRAALVDRVVEFAWTGLERVAAMPPTPSTPPTAPDRRPRGSAPSSRGSR
jgi:AcrR family transcriptional regulator